MINASMFCIFIDVLSSRCRMIYFSTGIIIPIGDIVVKILRSLAQIV